MTTTTTPLLDRVLLSFPSGHYCLPALFRILELRESTQIESACIECCTRPRLLINPEFVARHAATPEQLLMLVMHELHHLILGHTRLYPRVTPLDNLVFDAVINALMCSLFPEPEHTALFTGLYSARRFPECFLRPAAGWAPGGPPRVPPALTRKPWNALAPLHVALYSQTGVTYGELRAALETAERQIAAGRVPLLGDHRDEGTGSSSDGRLEQRSPVLLEELRRITERWPRPPQPREGRSPHELLEEGPVQVPRPGNQARLAWLLRRIGRLERPGRRPVLTWDPVDVPGPIPRADRRATVLRALGAQPWLYAEPLRLHGRSRRGGQVHVYLDVSGSIGNLVGPLYAAVMACGDLVYPRVHLFSTAVADVSLAELRRGVCRTTGGTSIACVARHLATHRVDRAVLITDGYVGTPGHTEARTLARTRLGVALTPQGHTRSDLQDYTNLFIELEPLSC